MQTERTCMLVVEKNETKREALSHHLTQLSYVVTTVKGVDEALDMLNTGIRAKEIDMIFLGTEISEKESCTFLERIKSDSQLSHVPVIAVFPPEDIDRAVKCIEWKAEDCLPEPIRQVLLKKCIDSFLEKKQLREQTKKQLRKIEQLTRDLHRSILPLGIALSAEKDPYRLLERILAEAMSVCMADRGVLYQRIEDNCLKFSIIRAASPDRTLGGAGGSEVPFPPIPLYDEASGKPNHREAAAYVALKGCSVNIPDISENEEFDFSTAEEFERNSGCRSVSSLTVPMKNHLGEVIGVLQLINAKDETTGEVIPFDSYHQLVVESLASLAAVTCNNQILLERQKEMSKFERDLQIGHEIQVNFLPRTLPQPSGWEIAARFHPARQVAGDFYDGFKLPGDKVGLVIADVCDKGVGPALFMALSRSLIRAFAEQHRPLGWMGNLSDETSAAFRGGAQRRRTLLSAGTSALLAVELTNKYIAENHSEMSMFATLFFGVLDPVTGVLTYVNGGHDPPLILGPDGTVKSRLMPTGPAVGMLPDLPFDIQKVTLDPGDLLMAYTDGVPDAQNPNGERFTMERFLSLLSRESIPSVATLLDRIEKDLYDHIGTADQFDDITMLVARRMPRSFVPK